MTRARRCMSLGSGSSSDRNALSPETECSKLLNSFMETRTLSPSQNISRVLNTTASDLKALGPRWVKTLDGWAFWKKDGEAMPWAQRYFGRLDSQAKNWQLATVRPAACRAVRTGGVHCQPGAGLTGIPLFNVTELSLSPQTSTAV